MTQTIRWGVIGCAGIAAEAVMTAIQSSRLGPVFETDRLTSGLIEFPGGRTLGSALIL